MTPARRIFMVLMLITVAVLPLSLSSARTASAASNPAGKILGMVPSHRLALPTTSSSGSQLLYNNGPVMTTNKVYTIFWIPSGYSVDATYQANINQFFQDVQAETGKTSSVYGASTQYSQQLGGATSYIQNRSTFMGTAVDTNPLPPTDIPNCPNPVGSTACVTDPQLQNEISNVIRANNWPVDNNTEYFIFTAKNINTCVYSTIQPTPIGNVNGPVCSFSTFCAYHSWYYDSTLNPNAEIIYSNMPYADTLSADCAPQVNYTNTPVVGVRTPTFARPNNSDADAEINVISHEHIESITDPYGTGWWDSNPNSSTSGQEIGDLCAWKFGTTSGAAGSEYNQTINGHHYIMQQEWSNADGGCVLKELPKLTVTPNIGFPTAPFRISGLFYNANENVPFTWQSAGSSTQEPLVTVTTDGSGHFSPVMTRVPTDATPGNGTVSGTGSVGQTTGSAAFTVPQ